MQKVIVLTNKLEFRYKNISNFKDLQIEYLELNISDLKNNICKLRCDVLIISKEYIGNMFHILSMLVNLKETLIVYISKNIEYGKLYNVLLEPNFILISEDNINALKDIILYASKIYKQYLALKNKVTRLETDLEANNLVKEAKLKIMKEKNLTENEAYKYIINLAMQKRMKKSELAKLIIGGLIL